jgi:hypothetical protein
VRPRRAADESMADGPAMNTGVARCAICNCDAAIYWANGTTDLAICRRPACEFEAFHLYPDGRLTPINPAEEGLL